MTTPSKHEANSCKARAGQNQWIKINGSKSMDQNQWIKVNGYDRLCGSPSAPAVKTAIERG
jgi:hypothetical protein